MTKLDMMDIDYYERTMQSMEEPAWSTAELMIMKKGRQQMGNLH